MPSIPTILIVEDNSTNLKLFTAVLKRLDCRIITADTGEQGLEVARQHKPDLILMDIQLPGISGIEATRILKSDPTTADICVVALTAHAFAEERQAAAEAGCSGYITKPIDTRAFPDQIRVFINP